MEEEIHECECGHEVTNEGIFVKTVFGGWINERINMNLIEHAKKEFIIAGYDPDEKDGPNRWIQDNILELLEVFSKQGHSGMSAPYCIGLFTVLASFEPITPLTGVDSEWEKVACDDDIMYQNLRCSNVFKGADGRAYNVEGIVFRGSDGICYTNKNSRVYIEFPYTPKTEYVDVKD